MIMKTYNTYEEKQTEWDGEGYPPVGVECEISNCGNDWMDCVVKFVGTDLCVVNHGNWEQHYHLSSVKFRPLETPEQKKEREELEAAYDLYCEWSLHLESAINFKDWSAWTGFYEKWLRVVRKTNYKIK